MKMDKNHYIEHVKKFIKNKEAKRVVSKELTYHIEQEKQRLTRDGLHSEEGAEEEAVKRMGNPIEVGKNFNQLYRDKTDWWMVFLLLMSVGISFLPVLVFNQDFGYLLESKFVYTFMGIGIAAVLFFLDYRKLQKWGWVFYGAGLLGLYFLINGPVTYVIGQPVLEVGPFSISGIYFIPLFILGFASFFSSPKAKLWKALIVLSIPLYLYLNTYDFISTGILIVLFFSMAWFINLNRKALAGMICGGSSAIALYLWLAPIKEYQLVRLFSFLHPEDYPDSQGYVYLRVQEMLSNTEWFGRGGNLENLPSGHTDFVLVSLTYNYGWIISFITILVLLLLMVRLVVVNLKISDKFGKMLITGGLAFYSVPFLYHLLMSFGLLPFMAFSLPFLSYGFHPMVLHAVVFGLILSVYRKKAIVGAMLSHHS
ncbi:FtsW/RodA/SpoVE family cell cycle protein [Halobacillus sp. GSS1]|uniref:FtsW/RodA/SpoVE family cell cycle protein n=1 Tax=Halobacillus sp. GSS1 TaxID=2815919 RepID=UPI001A8C4F90|nr:FtsW/RodA/SpoVE family cell cycle protein [Halobacillus sp. GSS1]MBN9653426.1 FtsW/RodA/SpoVE family cell cycle protein [Halobacillus sp. GSS1]